MNWAKRLHLFSKTYKAGLWIKNAISSHRFEHTSNVASDPYLSRKFLAQLWVADREMGKFSKRKTTQKKIVKSKAAAASVYDSLPVGKWFSDASVTENPPPSQSLSGFLDPAFPEETRVAPLLARSNLLITRDIEWANLVLGFEQENRYAIVDVCYPKSPVGFIREQSNVIARQNSELSIVALMLIEFVSPKQLVYRDAYRKASQDCFSGLSLDYPHWLSSRGFLGANSDGLASTSDMIPVFSCLLHLGGHIAVLLLRQRRPFVACITDSMGDELFRVRRPFWWLTSSIYAEIDGKEIGVVHRRWHLWRRIYDLYLG
ncbi:hypothetical protein DKX38_022754 [Salix brachista]|uniref:Phospholipid scramblase n=1 Tax=Salix brachista TaxID=2182728 RepID=A0A5N5K627_9ROSI|nr:hypothetical protein DKX38_022754 [Salix brachista]